MPIAPRRLAAAARRVAMITAALIAVACGSPAPTPAPARPVLPQASGTLAADGLTAPVRVVRDREGVPHLTALNTEDLFFAQGFVQAQDRLFQMDLWRRSAQGRLSEVLGSNFIERDAMTRRLQFRGDAAAEWASYGPDARRIADAFTRGVNAWIEASREAWPDEFRLAGWTPERWRADDLLNRTDAFVASRGAQDEVFRARVASAAGLRGLNALFPLERATARTAVDLGAITYRLSEALSAAGTRPFFIGYAAPYAAGSNAWAIPGRLTALGAPLLAADPHRRLDVPALRYLVHLTAPGWNVIGATSPWLPGVVLGHNDHVAWAMAAADEDVQDLLVERVNPANEHEVWRDGAWTTMAVEHEIIGVRGAKTPFEYDRLYTDHGPVVGVDRTRHLAYVLRWSGAEPGTAGELAAPALNQAVSADDFRLRLGRWKLPAADFVFADADGVQRQRAVLAPVRRGARGDLPAAAWSNELRWDGWRSLDDLPRAANGSDPLWAVNGDAAREQRLRDTLAGAGQTSERMRLLQQDVVNTAASRLLPLLAALPADLAPDERSAAALLSGWDQRMDAGSLAAALYAAWERHLACQIALRRLPADLVDEAANRLPLVPLMTASPPVGAVVSWFGRAPGPGRDEVVRQAWSAAVAETRTADPGGAGRSPWPPVSFTHPLALAPAAIARFNVGPFAAGGDAHTLQAISRDRLVGPALRLVFDLSAWDRASVVNAPGQSGWPDSPHYRDHAEDWPRAAARPLRFSADAVAEGSESVLTLVPKS